MTHSFHRSSVVCSDLAQVSVAVDAVVRGCRAWSILQRRLRSLATGFDPRTQLRLGDYARLHPQVSGFTTEPPESTAAEVTLRIAQLALADGSLLRSRALMSVEMQYLSSFKRAQAPDGEAKSKSDHHSEDTTAAASKPVIPRDVGVERVCWALAQKAAVAETRAPGICISDCHPDATTRLTAGTDGRAVAQGYPQPAAAADREAEACHDQSGSATLHERYGGHRALTCVRDLLM